MAAHLVPGTFSQVNQVDPSGNEQIAGIKLTADGGYEILWAYLTLVPSTPTTPTQVVKSWYEQSYDSTGQRVGTKTPIPSPTEDFTQSYADRINLMDDAKSYVVFSMQNYAADPSGRTGVLVLQHYAADGTPVDGQILLETSQGAIDHAALALPNGAIAIVIDNQGRAQGHPLTTVLLTPAS